MRDASSASVVKRSRPAAWFLLTSSSRPGSKIGIRPAFSASILPRVDVDAEHVVADLGEHAP